MFRVIMRVALATFIVFLIIVSFKTMARAEEIKATFAAVGEPTSIPYGWMDFCSRQPQECNQPVLVAQHIALLSSTWKTLNKINHEVNAAIEPISNLEHWGTIADHWDYPTDGKGDCKIYALQKRRLLIEQGFPRQALLMTIVKDQNDQGHAILTVVTSHGDFILDNMTNELRPWEKTGYRFLKRQSQEDPNIWVAVEPPRQQRQLSLR